MITFALSTFNTLNYLKLAIESVRSNSFYKDAPFIIHAENCTDGTNEWLYENKTNYNLTIIVEPGLVAKVPAEPSHTASKLGSIPTLPYAPRFTLLCEPGVW